MYSPQHASRPARPSGTTVLLTALAAFAAAGCSDAPTAPAAAAVAPSFSMATWQGTGTSSTITSRINASLCVDVDAGRTTPGTKVQLWSCNGGANQQFTWQSNGEIHFGAMCLDASGGNGRNGDPIILYTCNGGANQRWTGTAAGAIQGPNGRCLDLPGSNTANGTQPIIWDCNGGSNQSWDEHVATAAAPPAAPVTAGTPAAVLAFMAATNVPSVASVQARGGAYAKYESDFASYANTQWAADSTSFDANFYDRAMIYYVWWARTGNATYLDRANKLAVAARTYLESVSYYPYSYNMMIDGVALHALVTGDQRSATTVAKVADAMGNPNGYFNYVAGNPGDGDGDSRNSARVLSAVLDASLLHLASPSGYDYSAILPSLLTRVLTTEGGDGAYRWPNACNYNKPFMSGMLDDALIRYYTSFQADSRIVPAVKRAVDYMWNTDWVQSSGGFKYLDADCSNSVGGGSGTTSDLNNMISSGYAFVARQTGDASYYTKADAAFSGGVYGAWITGKKQFNQEYTASYRYLALRF